MKCVLMHFKQPHFQQERVIMKPATFFVSGTSRIFIKLLVLSQSSIKMKVRLHRLVSEVFLTSAVICKRRLSNVQDS